MTFHSLASPTHPLAEVAYLSTHTRYGSVPNENPVNDTASSIYPYSQDNDT